MSWRVSFSQSALKFLKKERRLSSEKVLGLIERSLRYFQGEDINIDIRKLGGQWQGFHRIRRGKLRIVAEFDFDNSAFLWK